MEEVQEVPEDSNFAFCGAGLNGMWKLFGKDLNAGLNLATECVCVAVREIVAESICAWKAADLLHRQSR